MKHAISYSKKEHSKSVVTALHVGSLLLAVVVGAATALTEGLAGLAICGLLIFAALLYAPRAAVWTIVVGGLVIAGLIELYLPNFQAIRWVFGLLSITIAGISLMQWLGSPKSVALAPTGSAPLAIALSLLVLTLVLAIIAGGLSIVNAVVGLKNYLQMWGLIFALAWLGYKPIDARRFIHFLGLLALVQMPFVLHQFFALVPQRSSALDAAHNLVAVDIVAGTFGGSMVGGGRSADLAVLASIAVVLFFSQWKAGMRSLGLTLSLSALAFAPILLNEAKLALVLLPVGLFLLFRQTITKRPFAWLMGSTALLATLALVIVGYSNLPGADSQQSKSIGSYIESSIRYNIGEQGYGSAVLNRTTVYGFWFNEHLRTGDVVHAVLGHGPGFANATAINRGDNTAATRYAGYAIGLTGVSTLLWDIGLLGTSTYALILLMAYQFAEKLRRRWQKTPFEPTLTTTQIGVVMIGISLLHNEYVSFDVGFQTMLAVLLGYLFAMRLPPSGEST